MSPQTGGAGGRESTCIECSRHFFATSCRALHAYNARIHIQYTHIHMRLNHPLHPNSLDRLSLCITCDSYVDRDESTFGSKTAGGLLRVRQIPRERCARFVSLFSPLFRTRARARALRYSLSLTRSLSFSRIRHSFSFSLIRTASISVSLHIAHILGHSRVKTRNIQTHTCVHIQTLRFSFSPFTPLSLFLTPSLSFSLFRP